MGGRIRLLQRLHADLRREDAHRDHQQNEEGANDRVEVVVECDALHFLDRLGRRDHGPLRGGVTELARQRHEADSRIGMEDLLHARGQRGDQQPCRGHQRDPHVALALHLHEHAGAKQQGDAGQHLVADAEELPQRVDAAERIDHPLIQEVAPEPHAQPGAEDVGGQVLGVAERLVHVTEHVLDHEPPDPCTGVDRRQDEQRLEQDREVVPERFHGLAAQCLPEDLRHSHGQRRGAAGARQDAGLADVPGGLGDHFRRDRESPARNDLGRVGGRRADDRGGRVHREVDARIEHARGRECHHRDERLGQHAAEADQAHMGFVLDHLRRRSRRDQRMKARDRTRTRW